MSILTRIFGDPKERELKNLFIKVQQRVAKEYGPMGKVGQAIIQAAVNCRDKVKDLIAMPDEKERQQREIYIFYEFIYFYMHMTMRKAFGELTEPEMMKLQKYLAELMSSVAIDSYFAHWPNDLKKQMVTEFYQKLNQAEMEYTQCTQFDTALQGDERNRAKLRALFDQLASNVATLAVNNEKDLAVMLSAQEISIKEWGNMRLDNLMEAVKEGAS